MPAREAFAALARLGVLALGTPGVPTDGVRCWAEVFPLRRAEPAADGLVLFDVPDRHLAALVARVRRRVAQVGVRLLPDPYTGRAWVTAHAPPPAVFLWIDEAGADVRVYQKQAEGVWTVRGWEHPLAAHLDVPDGSVLLCGPDRASVCVPGPVPPPRLEELPVPLQRTTGAPADPRVRIEVRFRLAQRDGPRDEALWVLSAPDHGAFETFCRTADERLLHRFQVATVQAGPDTRLVVRRADAADGRGRAARTGPGVPTRPAGPDALCARGRRARPVVRVRELVREFALGPQRIVWVEPAGRGIAVHAVDVPAFRSLAERLEYVVPRPARLVADEPPEETFPFGRFTVQLETSIELEPDPEPEKQAPVADEPAPGAEDDSSWVSKSVFRMVRWVRGQRQRAERAAAEPHPDPTRPPPRHPPRPVAAQNDGRVERKLASADALLHGHDWAARRHDLETRLLADFSHLNPAGRAARWAELAGVYGATGQSLDAAVCWTNALWEAPPRRRRGSSSGRPRRSGRRSGATAARTWTAG
ncbi:hypothetical protein [Frigoriglobus tundricola]|uniref:hypothetical protein n=1 Tax=Frigoriglobus tundricola TaxID=2774151 RepID=UPI0021BC4A44|nr:hypothetical protein [Frigoriglobus tundricola]